MNLNLNERSDHAGDDTFYLISETSKKSAMKMTAMMIEDSVESSDAPYDVQILEKQVSF
ncbi:MAG: hypothetical protein K6F54_08580 [Lachnospiraceae bacterium]|nr:hypothetical protein [Lachnospiraceae bacterium]